MFVLCFAGQPSRLRQAGYPTNKCWLFFLVVPLFFCRFQRSDPRLQCNDFRFLVVVHLDAQRSERLGFVGQIPLDGKQPDGDHRHRSRKEERELLDCIAFFIHSLCVCLFCMFLSSFVVKKG